MYHHMQVICLAALSPTRLMLTRQTDIRFNAEAAIKQGVRHWNAERQTPAEPWPAIVVQRQYEGMVQLPPATGRAMCRRGVAEATLVYNTPSHDGAHRECGLNDDALHQCYHYLATVTA